MQFEKDFAIAALQSRHPIWGLVEMFLITAFTLILSHVLRPNDPFDLSGPFPWILLAPVLCSLLYGVLNGIFSLLILLGTLIWQEPHAIFTSLPLRESIAGISLATLLTGTFSSYWFSRILHVERLNLYVREHLEAISREYYLLRVSHDRLEYAYISKPVSVRDAFSQIQQAMKSNSKGISQEAGQHLLGLFTQFCSINRAILYQYNESSQEAIPIARLGKGFLLHWDDPLLQEALKMQVTAYISMNERKLKNKGEYLAVIPLQDMERRQIGFIIIKDMSFWGLTEENLEVLSVFAAYFALQLSTLKAAQPILSIFPHCPLEFAQELEQLSHLRKYHHVYSSLTSLTLPDHPQQAHIIYSLQQQKRTLDRIWVIPAQSKKGYQLFITLMPLTRFAGLKGYQNRLDTWLQEEFSQRLNQNGFYFRSHVFNTENGIQQLQQFIKEVNDVLE